MATGQPYLSSYGDALLFETLSADPLLAQYCPGGVHGGRIAEGPTPTVVRFWLQSPGTDKPRQDGRNGRVLSVPTYVVVALDRQKTSADKVYGTIGSKLTPRQPYLQLAQRRIYDLLHAQSFERGGFRFALECFAEYPRVEELPQEGRDVQLGWWVRATIV